MEKLGEPKVQLKRKHLISWLCCCRCNRLGLFYPSPFYYGIEEDVLTLQQCQYHDPPHIFP
jgi:hypothetical protein